MSNYFDHFNILMWTESCINNVKLTLNCTKDYSRSRNSHHNTNSTYRRSKNRLTRGSLDNISANPWGNNFEESTLRRSRSLAVTRDDIFSSLNYPERPVRRRSQLIPRAKLIDRSTAKHTRIKGSSVESIHNYGKIKQTRRPSSLTPPDYSPTEQNLQYIEQRNYQQPESLESEKDKYGYSKIEHVEVHQKEESSFKKDSLNSNSRISYEDFQELSLPNYYPEARYDTDNTDIVSLTDNISAYSLDNLNKIKYQSLDNLDIKSEPYESIPYDDNIVLSTNKNLYESITNKPRTIRNPTPYYQINLRPDSSAEIKSLEQTDTNLDEIKLNNDNIRKTPIEDLQRANSSNSNIENNPLYESTHGGQIEKNLTEQKQSDGDKSITDNSCEVKTDDNLLKTFIEVKAVEDKSAENLSEQYKTIVTVEPEQNTKEIGENSCKLRKESKTHSHNYLKEFLESQKGSKKPLQNFIAKKFSNLSRRNSKERSNLTENQFHSLPDISVSKNLRKCEKIDRKLRKCEKSSHLNETSRENRFIVNIGRHFDITANSAVPVDFEVKIAKIPKKNRRHSTPNNLETDEQFIEAVKQLKETLHGSRLSLDENHNVTTEVARKNKLLKSKDKLRNMALLDSQDECKKEFKEKLGSMRNYWNNVLGQTNKDGNEEIKCKIVELKTKVEDVKKKFEKTDDKIDEKPQSKVQITKQLFEPKLPQEKNDKLSPLIKETCSYFENNTHQFENDVPFQSLCPTSVEIIDAKSKEKADEATDKTKTHKVLKKSNSISSKPEFDHVRYKVVKSDLFQKKIFANCEKESQFDDLIQYLQNYSFQELLVDNNIVIIEPIRSKVPYEPSNCVKSMKNITPRIHKRNDSIDSQNNLNRHFFYHPIRVNKEVNDEELPNPDTVRQVRQFFEGGLKKSNSTNNFTAGSKEEKTTEGHLDPDKDRCSATDSNSHHSNLSDFDSQENLYDSIDNEIYCEYVSEDILEKIRECGTTVTYYGGRVVNHKTGQPVLTKVIMEEIKNNQEKCKDCKNCRKKSLEKGDDNKETYLGVKFRILKSNSCSSRLELVGTESLNETKKKMLFQHKKLSKQMNDKQFDNIINEDEISEVDEKRSEKNVINETIKQQIQNDNINQPKIIAEEMKNQEGKLIQWKEIKNEKTYATINYNEKNSQKIYDYYYYDKVRGKTKKDDIEFEPYEVA